MGNRGRLIAPGDLRDELAGEAYEGPATGESLAGLAAQYAPEAASGLEPDPLAAQAPGAA